MRSSECYSVPSGMEEQSRAGPECGSHDVFHAPSGTETVHGLELKQPTCGTEVIVVAMVTACLAWLRVVCFVRSAPNR